VFVCTAGPGAGAVAFGTTPHPQPSNFMYICKIHVNGISLVGMLDSGASRTMGDKGFHIFSVATIPAMEAANTTLNPSQGFCES
jgi:hypothetical protein